MFIREYPEMEKFSALAEGAGVIPVCEDILADSETPVSLLGKFFKNDRSRTLFLLESVEGGERWGRYSFLGTAARAIVRIYEDYIEVEEKGESRRVEHGGDPLSALRQLMEKYTPAELPELPRFWGGLVGYMTFEFVSFIENRVKNKLPDGEPLARFVIPEELLIFDNISNSITVMSLVFTEDSEDKVALFNNAKEKIACLVEEINSATEPEALEQSDECRLEPVRPEEEYRDYVRKAKELITEGEIIQVVGAQVFRAKAPADLIALYRAQRYINPSPYMYFISIDGMQIIGSSPETMVRLEGRKATVRPIAGTRKRGESEQEDRALADELLKDEKERAEHLMLVDLGRNDLGRIAVTGTVQVTDMMFIERYSHVMHMVSNVECDMRPELDAYDLFAATFPAGTLSGAPKVRAMQIISDCEKHCRGPYGGAVGYISFSGNMDFAITIRTAIIEGDVLTAIAGAGLVYDSDPETERQETVNKAMSVQRALEMMQNSLQHRNTK